MKKHGRKSPNNKRAVKTSAESNKSTNKPQVVPAISLSPADQPPDSDEEAQGFGGWLKSAEGVELLRLFVIGNSIVVFLTMTWPHIERMFGIIKSMITGDDYNNKINHRHILAVLLTIAFAIGGIVEQSSSVALLANSNNRISAEEFARYVENTSYITRLCRQENGTQQQDDVHVVLSIPHIEIPMSASEETDAILREAFMWGCLISPLAAARIAARVGAERLFGYAVFGTGAAAILVPAAWLSPTHVALRIFQGVCVGATWPTAHMLAVAWIKPKDISTFVSCYASVNLGYAIVGYLGLPLVRTFGRDSLCYIISLSSFLWLFVWWRFVEDCLAFKTPKIQTKKHVPWRHLLVSGPVWGCGMAVLGSQWADATLMLGVLKYLKLVYGYTTDHGDVLSSLPHIGHFFAAITFGLVVDHIRATNIVSTTTTRKFFVYIAHFFPAALIFVLGYTGCDPVVPAALYTAALTLTAATPASSYASAVDLAPEYAGTIFGLCTTLGAAGLLAANYVVREGLHGSFAGWWRLVFAVASAELLITASIFMAVGKGSAMEWSSFHVPKPIPQVPTSVRPSVVSVTALRQQESVETTTTELESPQET